VARIVPLLSGPNTLVAMKVVEALGEIGGQTAFRALLDVLNGEDPELQGAAEEAVAKMQQEQGDDN
jgi:HEAT repeat protein